MNLIYMNGLIHLWWLCLLLIHVELYVVFMWKDPTHIIPYMSVWFYTFHELPTWMKNVFMSIVINIRYVDLYGLISLNSIYVNCAKKLIWCVYIVHSKDTPHTHLYILWCMKCTWLWRYGYDMNMNVVRWLWQYCYVE